MSDRNKSRWKDSRRGRTHAKPQAAAFAEFKLNDLQRAALERELQSLKTYLALRETAKHHLMRGHALMRRILVDAARGRRSKKRGGGHERVEFDEGLAVAYNDVDLCLRIGASGLRNLWTPFAELYHHESVSRGDDVAMQRPGFFVESQIMYERWGPLLQADPYFNLNLSLQRPDFELDLSRMRAAEEVEKDEPSSPLRARL